LAADYGNYTGIKSLFRVDYMIHGESKNIAGPYDWSIAADLPRGINPAALTIKNSTDGNPLYTLWDGGVLASESPDGPWTNIGGGCGGNPAPAFKDGVFYCTSQHTTELTSTSNLKSKFTKVSDINVTLANGTSLPYGKALPNVEDPFLWIDKRGNFHIINHRFDTAEKTKLVTLLR
jgi:hypothetical protein